VNSSAEDFDPRPTGSVVAPWLERDDWAEGRIVDSQKATAKVSTVICFAVSIVGFAPVGLLAMAALSPTPNSGSDRMAILKSPSLIRTQEGSANLRPRRAAWNP
jgi:hypothetical protein